MVAAVRCHSCCLAASQKATNFWRGYLASDRGTIVRRREPPDWGQSRQNEIWVNIVLFLEEGPARFDLNAILSYGVGHWP